MHCVYCGKQLSDDAQFCAYCGKPQPSDPVDNAQRGWEANQKPAGGAPANKLLVGVLVAAALAIDVLAVTLFFPKMGVALPEMPSLGSHLPSGDQDDSANLTGEAAHNNELLRQLAERNASSRQWESLAAY